VDDTSAVVGMKWKQDDRGGDVVETKWTLSEPGFVTTKPTDKSTALSPAEEWPTVLADITCPMQLAVLQGGRNVP
jgi:hypothetical protein